MWDGKVILILAKEAKQHLEILRTGQIRLDHNR